MPFDVNKYLNIKKKKKGLFYRLKVLLKLYERSVRRKRKVYEQKIVEEKQLKEKQKDDIQYNNGCLNDCVGCIIPLVVLLIIGWIISNINAPWWAILIIVLLLLK